MARSNPWPFHSRSEAPSLTSFSWPTRELSQVQPRIELGDGQRQHAVVGIDRHASSDHDPPQREEEGPVRHGGPGVDRAKRIPPPDRPRTRHRSSILDRSAVANSGRENRSGTESFDACPEPSDTRRFAAGDGVTPLIRSDDGSAGCRASPIPRGIGSDGDDRLRRRRDVPMRRPRARLRRAPPPSRRRLPQSATAATPAPTPAAGLAAEFEQFAGELNANVGVVLTAVGDGTPPVALGTWTHGPAWSTIKVPLSIAALRESPAAGVTDAMRGAIIRSDNAAADQVWQSLGTPDVAAKRGGGGAERCGCSCHGSSRANSTGIQCVRPDRLVVDGPGPLLVVGEVHGGDRADLRPDGAGRRATNSGASESSTKWEIKGGWGPSASGKYLVRQMGVVDTPQGETAVAIAAEPASGSFGDGTQVLTTVANWLKDHSSDLPGGQCPGGNPSTEASSTVESPAATVNTPSVGSSPTGSAPAVTPP